MDRNMTESEYLSTSLDKMDADLTVEVNKHPRPVILKVGSWSIEIEETKDTLKKHQKTHKGPG